MDSSLATEVTRRQRRALFVSHQIPQVAAHQRCALTTTLARLSMHSESQQQNTVIWYTLHHIIASSNTPIITLKITVL